MENIHSSIRYKFKIKSKRKLYKSEIEKKWLVISCISITNVEAKVDKTLLCNCSGSIKQTQ